MFLRGQLASESTKWKLQRGGGDTHVVVDPARPDAWKKEPYYSSFKGWAQAGIDEGLKVIVAIGKRGIVILPDRDVDLGLVGDDDRIVTVREEPPLGYRRVLWPFLIADDLVGEIDSRPTRYVIDFMGMDQFEAQESLV